MRPPYHPRHVEAVYQRGSSGVVAHCSCTGTLGPVRRLGTDGVARALADDFNAHRATYVEAVPA